MGHRDALLEATIRCLYEKGYARTTARDLVSASGANLASIGYHFGSKEKLLNEALDEAFRRWISPLVAMVAEPATTNAWESLRERFIMLRASLDTNRPIVVAFFEALAQAERSEELRRHLAAHYDEFRTAVASVVESTGGLGSEGDAADHRTIASLLMAVFDGLMVQWILDPKAAPTTPELLKSVERAMTAVAPLFAARGGIPRASSSEARVSSARAGKA